MKSNEMWCYRFSRQCVARSVAVVGSDAAVGSEFSSDAAVCAKFALPPGVK